MRWWPLVIVLGGCNQILGLGPTAESADLDGDGIPNDLDRCPTTADPLQEDNDGDGTGDACDLCPGVADNQHDEDKDGVGDVCDLCPGLRDPDQLDSDGDRVGDECEYDRVVVPTTQLSFDPFVTMSPSWTTTGTAWQLGTDEISVTASPGVNDPGLRNSALKISSPTFIVEVGFTATRELRLGDRLGVGVIDAQGNPLGCWLICDKSTSQLCGVIVLPKRSAMADDVVVSNPTRMLLRFIVYGSDPVCEVLHDAGLLEDDTGDTLNIPLPVDLTPVIYGMADVNITHFIAWKH